MNPKTDIEQMSISSSKTISRREYDSDPAHYDFVMKERIRQYISESITFDKLVKFFTPHRVDYRCDLIVATPEMFWKQVHQEAKRLVGNSRIY